MTEREQFGPLLRRERERRGITLQDVATQTKISTSFFAALERNDFSRWPGGIFRRSFVRSYAQAVGLDPERTVGDFARLFPPDEDGSTRQKNRSAPPSLPPPQPLHAASSTTGIAKGSAGSARRRMAIAAIELALAGGVGVAVGMALDWFYAWPALGVGALAVAAANLRLKRKPVRPATIAPPAAAPVTHARHITKRRATERHEAGRRRARRAERRRPRA